MAKAKKPNIIDVVPFVDGLMKIEGRLTQAIAASETRITQVVRERQVRTENTLTDVLKTMTDIDHRTREMRSVQYIPTRLTPPWVSQPSMLESVDRLNKSLQPGQAPPCFKCGAHRDANVHINKNFLSYHEYLERPEATTTREDMYRAYVLQGGLDPIKDLNERLQKLEDSVGCADVASIVERLATLERRYSELAGKDGQLEARMAAQHEQLKQLERTSVTTRTRDEIWQRLSELEAKVSTKPRHKGYRNKPKKKDPGTGNVAMYEAAAKKR